MSPVTRCWSEAPADILSEIIRHLRAYADFVRFGGVCQPWRRARTNSDSFFVHMPALAFPYGEGAQNLLQIYNPSDHKTHKIPFPDLGYAVSHCVGASSNGVLITYDDDLEIRASNPFTGEHVPLPPTGTLPLHDLKFTSNVYGWREATAARNQGMYLTGSVYVTDSSYIQWFVTKAILDSSSNYRNRLVVLRWDGSFAWTTGPCWKAARIKHPGGFHASDMVFHRGIVHAIDWWGRLFTFDPDRPDFRHPDIREALLDLGGSHLVGTRYCTLLVQSDDGEELFMVHRTEPPDRSMMMIRVFELEDADGVGRWREVMDVGEKVFFMNLRRTMSVSTREYPQLKKNCIYFQNGCGEFDGYERDRSHGWIRLA